jgi:hypothetical protein
MPPGGWQSDPFAGLFGEGGVERDWLEELAATLEVIGERTAQRDCGEGTWAAATGDGDTVSEELAGDDGGAESAGGGGE